MTSIPSSGTIALSSRIGRLSSIGGLVALFTAFISLHYFSIYKQQGDPSLSVPFASLFIAATVASIICLHLNLTKRISNKKYLHAGVIFVAGFGVTTLLIAISFFGLSNEFLVIPDNLTLSPAIALSSKLDQFQTLVASVHWWVHLVLGLALLTALATVGGLIASTDIVGALNACILGPFFGITLLALLALAFYAALALAMGAIALFLAYVKLASAE
ncbi:hypothetical protein [Methylomonas sp. UP202]|uniref:hypothetical protein n=1 Tax=Methylomonas sp. UP202 TaxID=3040943 RepID=UPI00247B220F|nr:hypothetical protein [Methylomonas sp. UP202]WGS86940.1 hypothetical protein QC632_04100 [Methylomonas sp. UP202]